MGLSAKAKRDKAKRDLAFAKTPARRAKKAENQRKRRAAKKAGKNIKGKDYDHATGRFETVSANRGNRGKGTKKESPMAKKSPTKRTTGGGKKKTLKEMAKKAVKSGWKPKPRKKKKTLKEMAAAAAKRKASPAKRKRNPKRDSAKKASKGKASASYYSHGLTTKKSPAKRKKK